MSPFTFERARRLARWRHPHNEDRAGSVLRYRLRHAPEQEFLQPLSSVRSKDDTAGPPHRGHLKNADFRLAFDHARKDFLKSRGTDLLSRMTHDLFSSSMPLLHTCILFKERRPFDYVDKENLGGFRTYLCCQHMDGRIGEWRTVDCQQYPHGNPLVGVVQRW